MATNGERAHQLYLDAVGSAEGSGDWFEIDQARIDAFADVTEDHQFIHVDPEACATLSPWGVPVAHGFLTLSLLTKLTASVPTPPERLEGVVMASTTASRRCASSRRSRSGRRCAPPACWPPSRPRTRTRCR
jgi:acyl dehydratase